MVFGEQDNAVYIKLLKENNVGSCLCNLKSKFNYVNVMLCSLGNVKVYASVIPVVLRDPAASSTSLNLSLAEKGCDATQDENWNPQMPLYYMTSNAERRRLIPCIHTIKIQIDRMYRFLF